MSPKDHIKALLSPAVRAAWPLVESIGELEARATRGDVRVQWSDAWSDELDAVLEALPPVQGWPRDLYRELLKPTRAQKRHALVRRHDMPIALISLRRCARHWEPVAYQCIPFVIAPALHTAALATALNVLGMEVRVPAGIRDDVGELHPSDSWAYDCHRLDLTGDFEAYWRERKRHKRIRKARAATEHLQRHVDGAGDMAWVVEGWREQWRDDPGQESLAAEDRLSFWGALERRGDAPMRLHTLTLNDGSRRVAGLVLLCNDDVALTQCSFREPDYNDAGTATNIFAAEWAKDQGLRAIDFGGGEYKRDWGEPASKRHGAVFRPRVMNALAWACTY